MNNPLRNNLLFQGGDNKNPNFDALSIVSRLLACLLILSGASLLVYLLMELYAVYQQPTVSPFFSYIKQIISDKALFYQEGSPPYLIGEGGAMAAAIVIFILFASMMLSVAIGLVRAGAQILSLKSISNPVNQTA